MRDTNEIRPMTEEEDYAETQAARWPYFKGVVNKERRVWNGTVEFKERKLLEPLSWREPRKVFVNSMSDLFHESVPDEWIDRIFAVMALAKQHTFQILTKRPERMRAYTNGGWQSRIIDFLREYSKIPVGKGVLLETVDGGKLANVWLGVTCEDQKSADERIPLLLQTPAVIRFVSYEPALEYIDFSHWLGNIRRTHMSASVEGMLRNKSFRGLTDDNGNPMTRKDAKSELELLRASGVKFIPMAKCDSFDPQKGCPGHKQASIDWIICGGESGKSARPFDLSWARMVRDQCKAAGVALFMKQLGSMCFDYLKEPGGRCAETRSKTVDRSGADPSEWPEDLRVQDFPE